MEDAFYMDLNPNTFFDILGALKAMGGLAKMATCMYGPSGEGADHPDMLDNADINGYNDYVYRDGIGYTNATDCFIPVDSSHFGEYLGTYYWNHADEQNMTIGFVNTSHTKAQDPISYYEAHANLLKIAVF